jgi:opacity protein-like surface antigen
MHKIATTIALIALTSTVFADPNVSSPSTNFYFTVGGGIFSKNKISNDNFINQLSQKYPNLRVSGEVPSSQIYYKTKNLSAAFVGMGYRVFDRLRLEAVYIKPFIPKIRHNYNVISENGERGDFDYYADRLDYHKISSNIDALQVRGYFDFFQMKNLVNFYIGAGVGISQLHSSGEIGGMKLSVEKGQVVLKPTRISVGKKKQISMNYMFGAGANLSLAEGITLGVGYEFQNFGTLKGYQNNLYKQSKQTFKNHGVVVKLMYNI